MLKVWECAAWPSAYESSPTEGHATSGPLAYGVNLTEITSPSLIA